MGLYEPCGRVNRGFAPQEAVVKKSSSPALRNRVTIRCDHCEKTMAKAVVDRGPNEMSLAMKVFEDGIRSHSPKCPYRHVAVTFSIMPVGPGAHSKIGGGS